MTERTTHEQEAYDLGVTHACNAASWIIDGNTDPGHYRRLVAMLDDGDPAAEHYLPARPNLSGEWADDMTPHSLALDIFGTGDDAHLFEEEDVERIADAYEQGVGDTFEVECKRLLREAIA